MKYLFGPAGTAAMRRLCARGALLAFDFDGTLAPTVPSPDAAKLDKETDKLLKELKMLAPVAVVSGRAQRDVARRVPSGIWAVLGNHGVEGLPGTGAAVGEARRTVRRWRAFLEPELRDHQRAWLEDKALTLTVHRPDERVRSTIVAAALFGGLPASRLVPGVRSINILPAESPNKGTAMEELLRLSGRAGALYMGNEETDEDVFQLRDPRILGVRVGRSKASAAPWYVRSQRDVVRVLRFLRDELKK